MKFKFPYENLLNNKKTLRDVAAREFSEAEVSFESSKKDLNSMYSQIEDTRKNSESIGQKRVIKAQDIELMKWADYFLEGQKIRIQHQRQELQKKNQALEERREVLEKKAQEFKIFEKLKSKMKDKFKDKQKKLELKAIDELVVMRAGRKSDNL